MNCEFTHCSKLSRVRFLATDLYLCLWHFYLFKKAGQSDNEKLCRHLLHQIPTKKRKAEEGV